MMSSHPGSLVRQGNWPCHRAESPASPTASVAALRLLGMWMVSFLQESTLVGQHCKCCQQKTTKGKVQGSQANSFISVSFKTLICSHHKAWNAQEASKRDDQTHPTPNTQGHKTVGTKLALQPTRCEPGTAAKSSPQMCFYS